MTNTNEPETGVAAAPGRGGRGETEASARWRAELDDAPFTLDLPTDRVRDPVRRRGTRFETAWATPEVGVERLEGAFAAALALVLGRHAGQRDLVLGWAVSDRWMPWRVRLDGGPTGAELARELERRRAEYADPHTEIAARLGPIHEPHVRVGAVFGAGLDTDPRAAQEPPELDLAIAAVPEGAQLRVGVDYDATLFDESTIARLVGHVGVALTAIAADPERRLDWIPILTPDEERRLLITPNATTSPFPDDRCLHELFEQHVAAAPERVAVVCTEGEITYAELDRRANRLAHHLRAQGVGPEVRVGLAVERSIDLPVGILGILMAGGAYVPLDPSYPEDRVAFMLHDARVALLVTTEPVAAKLPDPGCPVVRLDADRAAIESQPDTTPASGVGPTNLAYVIYTSGSTGQPKGIALRHRGVVNNIYDLNDSFGVGPDDRVLAISAMSFDMCVYEVLGLLGAGGGVVVPDPVAAREPRRLAELVKEHRVTVWNSAPALLEMYVDYVERTPELAPPALRLAIQGGDWEPVSLPERLARIAPGVLVVVLGGATESSIHSIVFPVREVDPSWTSIPYGVPQRNQRAYILDDGLMPVPEGVAGELYLAGIGLARGYFDRPALTAERFLPNSFPPAGVEGDRLYRTGDLARWMPDGNIELLGRLDHQVKIRGHRIELGEIAAVLREDRAVADTVVSAWGEGADKRLVAYVVPDADTLARAAESEASADGHAEQIEQWQKVYDDTYGQTVGTDRTRNFVGWHSSYTGEPFSDAELDELQAGTIAGIRELEPRSVLEIGCGTGLVLFPLAPDCERYDGRELSPVVVDDLRALIRRPGRELPHVSVSCAPADDFDGVEAGVYDTVVVNSVAQHFPSLDYLALVLEGAARVVRPGGAIYVGDVRSHALLGAFHASLEAFADPNTDDREFTQRVRRRIWQENELFVDPSFFADLRHRIPAIKRVQIRLRPARHHNEMSRFHYDVALFVGGTDAPSEPVWTDWEGAGLDLEALRRRLAQGPDVLAVRGVPNARVTSAVADLARTGDVPAPPDGAVDPDALQRLAAELGYRAELCWHGDERGHQDIARIDVCFHRGARRDAPAFPLERPAPEGPADRSWRRYANDPLQASHAARLAPPLKRLLEERLPEYMVPSSFVFLSELPKSPNGKIDRKALPAPVAERLIEDELVGARDAVESIVAGIWAEALEVDRLGVHDDFFELGGHSLSAAKVVSRAREAFQIDVALRSLFEEPTVARWSQRIAAEGAALGIDVGEVADVLIQLEGLSEDEVRAALGEDDG